MNTLLENKSNIKNFCMKEIEKIEQRISDSSKRGQLITCYCSIGIDMRVLKIIEQHFKSNGYGVEMSGDNTLVIRIEITDEEIPSFLSDNGNDSIEPVLDNPDVSGSDSNKLFELDKFLAEVDNVSKESYTYIS